jgi:hypothetical protein
MTTGDGNDAPRRDPSSRDATSSPRFVEFGCRPRLILERLESPGRRPWRPQLRVPPSAGRGVARLAAPPTPVQSAPRGATARRSADTPGHRAQTFAASTRPTATHRPGTAWRGSRPRQRSLTVRGARYRPAAASSWLYPFGRGEKMETVPLARDQDSVARCTTRPACGDSPSIVSGPIRNSERRAPRDAARTVSEGTPLNPPPGDAQSLRNLVCCQERWSTDSSVTADCDSSNRVISMPWTCWSKRDDRPFRNCTSFAGANCGGATTSMLDVVRRHRAAQNPHFARRTDLAETIARTLCDFAPQRLVPILRDRHKRLRHLDSRPWKTRSITIRLPS